jgi:hypothetical protein
MGAGLRSARRGSGLLSVAVWLGSAFTSLILPETSPGCLAASGNSKFTLGLLYQILCHRQFIGLGIEGALAVMLHVNPVVGAYGLDDDAGLFHEPQYAKQFKLGHCKNQIRPVGALAADDARAFSSGRRRLLTLPEAKQVR